MKTFHKLFAAATFLALSASAHADVYKIDFTYSNLTDIYGESSPFDQVSGSVTYTSASTFNAVTTINGFDLSIGGHTYNVAEIGQESNASGLLVGGLLNTVNQVNAFTDDFYAVFYTNADKIGTYLVYATASSVIYYTYTGGVATVTDLSTSVPEPGSITLLLAGVMGMGLASRLAKR